MEARFRAVYVHQGPCGNAAQAAPGGDCRGRIGAATCDTSVPSALRWGVTRPHERPEPDSGGTSARVAAAVVSAVPVDARARLGNIPARLSASDGGEEKGARQGEKMKGDTSLYAVVRWEKG